MEERFQSLSVLIDEQKVFQALSIGVADFVREAIGQSVEIDRATASWQTTRGLKWRRILRVGVAVNAEIGDIATCAIVVNKVKEVEIWIAWVEAPSKI